VGEVRPQLDAARRGRLRQRALLVIKAPMTAHLGRQDIYDADSAFEHLVAPFEESASSAWP
jgi:hypothetical protein